MVIMLQAYAMLALEAGHVSHDSKNDGSQEPWRAHMALSTRKQVSTTQTARRPLTRAHQLMTGKRMYTTGQRLINRR